MKHTTHTAVIPFYVYAALAFLLSAILLATSTPAFTQGHFHPHTLAITHSMALGWGTMIILGASHQLIPVLIDGKLFSVALAYISFVLAATGIPFLVYAFYVFNMGFPARFGGILINAAILVYLVNITASIVKSKQENVQAVFLVTATCWLLATTAIGLMLVYNFAYPFLPKDSLFYLPFHMHLGIAGWFLLLVIGVGSKLIPLFLVSKYEHNRLLWWIYLLINCGLAGFILLFLKFREKAIYLVPVALVAMAVLLFGIFCYRTYGQRIRKQIDHQMKISLLSVLMFAIPFVFLIVIIAFSALNATPSGLPLAYGFTIFFGWITSIILGMTFKTLPFIVWNKAYQDRAGLPGIPAPKDLFNYRIFAVMAISYLAGFVLFTSGIIWANTVLLTISSALLVVAAILYNLNVFKLVIHKPG